MGYVCLVRLAPTMCDVGWCLLVLPPRRAFHARFSISLHYHHGTQYILNTNTVPASRFLLTYCQLAAPQLQYPWRSCYVIERRGMRGKQLPVPFATRLRCNNRNCRYDEDPSKQLESGGSDRYERCPAKVESIDEAGSLGYF